MPRTSQFILLFVACLTACGAQGRETTSLDLLGEVTEMMSKDGKIAAKVAVSPAYDRWFKLYMAGKKEKAMEAWGEVLDHMKEAQTIIPLERRAATRVAFADPVSKADLGQQSYFVLFVHWLRATKKKCGMSHRFTGDCYASLANYYEASKKYSIAATYRTKQLKCYENSRKGKQEQVLRKLLFLSDDLIKSGKHAEGKVVVERAMSMSKKLGRQDAFRKSANSYSRLLRTLKRGG